MDRKKEKRAHLSLTDTHDSGAPPVLQSTKIASLRQKALTSHSHHPESRPLLASSASRRVCVSPLITSSQSQLCPSLSSLHGCLHCSHVPVPYRYDVDWQAWRPPCGNCTHTVLIQGMELISIVPVMHRLGGPCMSTACQWLWWRI